MFQVWALCWEWYVHVFYTHAKMWVCAPECGSQKLTLSVFLDHSPLILSLNLELAHWLDWLAKQAPGSFCLHIPNAGVTGGQHHRTRLQVLKPVPKALCQLSHPLCTALSSLLWKTQSCVDNFSLGSINKQVGVWETGDSRGSRTPWHKYHLLSILYPPTDCLVFCWLPLSSVQTPLHLASSRSFLSSQLAPDAPPWHLQ